MADGHESDIDDERLREMVLRAAEERATGKFSPLLTIEEVEEHPVRWVGSAAIVRAKETRNGDQVREWQTRLDECFGGEDDGDYRPEVNTFFSVLRDVVMPPGEGRGGFVIAGGFVCSLVSQGYRPSAQLDIDFFPVGLDAGMAEHRVNQLLNLLWSDSAEHLHPRLWPNRAFAGALLDRTRYALVDAPEDGVTAYVYRTPNAITINIPTFYRLQFITRLYPTQEAVVRDFDIGPCQMLYDGYRLRMTELAAFAYRTRLFPPELDHCVCPSTYARRLGKYMQRGWHLILLDASPEAIIENMPYYLPGMGVSLEAAGGHETLVAAGAAGGHATPEAAREAERHELGAKRATRIGFVADVDGFCDTWPQALDGESTKRLWNTELFERPEGEPEAHVNDLSAPYAEFEPSVVIAGHRGRKEKVRARTSYIHHFGSMLIPVPYLYRALHYDPTTCAIANLRALLKGDPWRAYYHTGPDRNGRATWRPCLDDITREHVEELGRPGVNEGCHAMYQSYLDMGSPSVDELKTMIDESSPELEFEYEWDPDRETLPEPMWYGVAYNGTVFVKPARRG
jgi:hypothetical protein